MIKTVIPCKTNQKHHKNKVYKTVGQQTKIRA